ncbi:MAG: hypothetical protein ACRDPM_19620 [Solirubrobacteraceae bacterium]
MQHPTYQTVRISKGRHTSSDHGACVMELASMLAGEPFSDHPCTASPTIAAFLRRYNDLLDDDRRQDLYWLAADVVGTAGDDRTEHARAIRLVAWADGSEARRARWSPFVRLVRRKARTRGRDGAEEAARYAMRVMPRVSDHTHARVLRLIAELIAIGTATTGMPAAGDTEAATNVGSVERVQAR